jgi:hypothetical protein
MGGSKRVMNPLFARASKEGCILTRQMPKFRPSKFTAIAVGGAFCLAAAGSVSAATLSSSSSNGNAAAAAGLTSQTVQAQQRAATQTMVAAAQAAAAKAAAAKAAQDHAAHAAHQQHVQILAARAEAARAAAQRAAAAKAAAAKEAAAKEATAEKATQQQAASVPSGSPQQIAQDLLDQQGMGSQFSCLNSIFSQESGWSVTASNPSSGAYGIPQALPGSKMASAGPDWQTNAETQIKWGLQYIDSTYGSPCAAWSHEQSDGWY